MAAPIVIELADLASVGAAGPLGATVAVEFKMEVLRDDAMRIIAFISLPPAPFSLC